MLLVLFVCAAGVVRSASQLTAMQIFSTHPDRASLVRAAKIDPGNFRLRVRLARSGRRSERCEHAKAAKRLYPHAGIKLPCT